MYGSTKLRVDDSNRGVLSDLCGGGMKAYRGMYVNVGYINNKLDGI